MTPTKIEEFEGEYRFLSNFWPSPMRVFNAVLNEVVIVPTVEHGYQAEKTLDPVAHAKILRAGTPKGAKAEGKHAPLRADWESIKLDRMRFWLQLKFDIPELRTRLLATGDAELVESNWWNDSFWGVCRGEGENWLGRLLMERRGYLMKRGTT